MRTGKFIFPQYVKQCQTDKRCSINIWGINECNELNDFCMLECSVCSALKKVPFMVRARGITGSLQRMEDECIYKVEVMENFEI